MEKLLIINADDFGLCKGQNYGIIDAFTHGVVTSTTAMVNAEGIEQAATLSAAHPELAVGMHFVLTTGRPLSAMPGLVDSDGKLNKNFWTMAQTASLPLAEIEQELVCQFARFTSLFGRPPTHIDSHHHVHMHPQLFSLVEAFAQDKGIAVRIDRNAIQKDIQLCGAVSTQGFESGFYGNVITESLFLQALDRSMHKDEQSLEIMCHPAFIDNTLRTSSYCYSRLSELEVLTSSSLRDAIAERGYRLGTYRDLVM